MFHDHSTNPLILHTNLQNFSYGDRIGSLSNENMYPFSNFNTDLRATSTKSAIQDLPGSEAFYDAREMKDLQNGSKFRM